MKTARLLRPTRAEVGAVLGSAVLFTLAFPPFRLLVPGFLCLVPITIAIARASDEWDAARIGLWFCLAAYGFALYWIAVALSIFTWLASLGYVAALIWLAPWLALTAAVLWIARRLTGWPMAILLPVVWVASELLLTHLGDLAFPWLPLGLAVSTFPHLAQLADLSGVHGLTAWLALSNGLIADAALTRRYVVPRLAAVVALAAAVYGYGAWRLATTPLKAVAPIAVVQPNVPEDEKIQEQNRPKFFGIMAAATRAGLATSQKPALIVWPEASLPDFMSNHPEWADSLRILAQTTRAPLLFGVLDVTWRSPTSYDYFNAAELADSNGVVGAQPAYHKEYLVPIVERVPFVDPRWFAGLKYFGGFGRGVDPEPYRLPFGGVGVLICYESIFPDLSRRYRREGAAVLANITNDAWFGHSFAPYQHVAHLRLRAIENRVGIVRAANTGISEYVDPLGRVHGETGLFVPANRTFDVETTDVQTLYVRWGDWVATIAALLTVTIIGVEVSQRRRARR